MSLPATSLPLPAPITVGGHRPCAVTPIRTSSSQRSCRRAARASARVPGARYPDFALATNQGLRIGSASEESAGDAGAGHRRHRRLIAVWVSRPAPTAAFNWSPGSPAELEPLAWRSPYHAPETPSVSGCPTGPFQWRRIGSPPSSPPPLRFGARPLTHPKTQVSRAAPTGRAGSAAADGRSRTGSRLGVHRDLDHDGRPWTAVRRREEARRWSSSEPAATRIAPPSSVVTSVRTIDSPRPEA